MLDLQRPLTYLKSDMNSRTLKTVVIIAILVMFSQGYLVLASDNMSSSEKYAVDDEQNSLPYGGTAEELSQIDEIERYAMQQGYPVKRTAISSEGEFHSFSSILSIQIAGRLAHKLRLIVPISMPVAVPLRQFDPNINVLLLKSIIEKFKERTQLNTIEVVVLGDASVVQPGNSALIYLRNTNVRKDEQIIVLSFASFRSGFKLFYTSQNRQSPYELFQSIVSIAKENDLSLSVDSRDTLLAMLGFGNDLRLGRYLDERLAAIAVSEDPLSSTLNTAQGIANYVGLVEAWSNKNYTQDGAIDYAEKNFVPLIFLNQIFVVREFDLVVTLILFFFLQMLFLFTASSRSQYFFVFFRDLSASLLVTLLYFSIAWFGIALVLPIFEGLTGWSILWTSSIILSSVVLSLFLLDKFETVIPRNSAFLSVNALVFTNLSLLLMAIINITLTIIALVPSLLMVAVVFLRSRRLKLLFLLLSLLSAITLLLVTLSGYGQGTTDAAAHSKHLTSSLVASLFILPHLFQIQRLSRIFPLHRSKHPSLIKFTTVLIFFILASCLSFLVLPQSWFPGKPWTIEQNTSELQSTDVSVTFADSVFLGRKRRVFQIDANQQLAKIELTINVTGETTQILYCNFPVKYLEDGEVLVLLGTNPPIRLKIELVIEEDFLGSASFKFYPTDSYGQAGIALEKKIDW